MSSESSIDASSLSRMRWMVVDRLKYTNLTYTNINDNSIYSNANIGTSSATCTKEPAVVVMRRLLKPMYRHESQKQSQIDSNGLYATVAFSDYYASIDDKVFVDMSDRTMWLAVGEPVALDDFFKEAVSDDLQNSKHIGYVLDKDPSAGLVPLSELKRTFAEWWCN